MRTLGTRLLITLGLGALVICLVGASGTAAERQPAPRPDIVFILMDDFSLELLQTMRNAQQLIRDGASYRNAFVIDSLCCPSRSSLLTGQTPRQTGVRTNTPNDGAHPIGGWAAFQRNGNPGRAFNVHLQESGYTTGFVGKYLNGYEATEVNGRWRPPPVIPGWSENLGILSGGYNGWGFKTLHTRSDGTLAITEHPAPDRDAPAKVKDRSYATNVAADSAVDFIDRHRDQAAPYFLEVATYGPHSSMAQPWPGEPDFPPAFADRSSRAHPGGSCGLVACSDLTTADLVGYDDPRADNAPHYRQLDGRTTPAPPWRTNRITLTPQKAVAKLRNRARMVQAVDRLIARVRKAAGPDAYVVLTADNGFHLGQHQLNGGKGTPYDSDTRVPLVVAGPGVKKGPRDQFVTNLDLAPTFERLAGLQPASFRSGTSIVDSLRDPKARGGKYAYFEHTYTRSQPGEVDADRGSGGTIDIIPSFVAIRGKHGLLARFDLDNSWKGTNYAWELYRYDVPWEDRNVFPTDHDKPWAKDLARRLEKLDGCRPEVCRSNVR